MKVLFFTSALPLPAYSGGQVRSLNLIKELSAHHEITVYSFIRQESEKSYVDELKKYVAQVQLFWRRPLSSSQNLRFLTRLPFAAALYFDPQIAAQLLSNQDDFDLMHFESFYTFCYLNPGIRKPQIAGNQNIEYRIYERYAQTKNPLVKSLMKIDISRMKSFEERVWRQASVTLSVSRPDQEVIEKVVGSPSPLVPNGIDLEIFTHVKKEPPVDPVLLFVGPTKYIQNNDAALYLVREIWPEIKQRYPKAKLWFVGREQKDWLLKENSQDLIVSTDLTNITQAYTHATCLLAPIRAGGGTKFKILEAMASGLPVITTPTGVEGIEARDQEAIMIAQTPSAFVEKLTLLLEDKPLNARITQRAKLLVRQHYSWKKIGETLNQVYAETAQK